MRGFCILQRVIASKIKFQYLLCKFFFHTIFKIFAIKLLMCVRGVLFYDHLSRTVHFYERRVDGLTHMNRKPIVLFICDSDK